MNRGWTWVFVQLVLFAALIWGARVGQPVALPAELATAATAIGWTLIALGGALALLAMVHLAGNLTPLPEPRENATLVVHGIYRYARHPIYGGVVLISLGSALSARTPLAIIFGLILPVFFIVKSTYEERRLRRRFPGYDAYARGTRRMVPWVW